MNSAENTKLCDFSSTNNNDFLSTPIDPPAPDATFYEIKPALLNLVMREKFSGAGSNDPAAHVNSFVELCEMQKYKDVVGDIIKLKLFPFSLRGKAKEWLLSLPRNSIDSWIKCKDAFIGKYYPLAKIISMRSEIMKFKQLDNEDVAQAWERMKSLVKNCPTHGLTAWMIIQTFYAGLNFSSRNLLDSSAGGTFMTITLGAAAKLLDNMMVNYSEWHTERDPHVKKVNSVEETSSLSDKIDCRGVTPSESDLCKFGQNSPNPHRNDSKVPTRHFRAGGKQSNNITQQSSMGPTEQIYIQQRLKESRIQI